MTACEEPRYVVDKLAWMRAEDIWPNGLRYLWTDAFGVVLLVSLYAELGEREYLDEAEWVVAEVDRVLGRPAAFASAKRPTAMASISITLPCGFMRFRPRPACSGLHAKGSGARRPDPRWLCRAGPGRGLEDEART